MCLITKWRSPRTAKQDIVVYKILRYSESTKYFSSIYYRFNYATGIEYKVTMKAVWSDTIGEPYDLVAARAYAKTHHKVYHNTISKGFHSAISERRLYKFFGSTIVKCVIPKGSLYYKDTTGLIVSNRIIIKERI